MVKTKEVLVLGAGIAGCAVALALAKKGISVTIATSSFDQRIYHALFIQHEKLAETVSELQQKRQNQWSCSRAHEQLSTLARKSIDELLESHYLVDRNGNVDIHRCLQEQLLQYPHVEWLSQHTVIELLTLDRHSVKKADRYKKPTCVGMIAYNYETKSEEVFLAKETILATGGAASLYPFSTHSTSSYGQGFAIAHRAGARLLNMDQMHFHPLGLYKKNSSCFPLPLQLLEKGAKIYTEQLDLMEISNIESQSLLYQLYDEFSATQSLHAWLDVTHLDPLALKEEFPTMDTYCLNQGFNIVKDLLPIVPVASYNCGGVAVDRNGQTSLQRLRAIGEVACTGIFWNSKDETVAVLESLIWASACADDISKQLPKLVYYFPEVTQTIKSFSSTFDSVKEDWQLLRNIMWSYGGIKRDRERLQKAKNLLEQLQNSNHPSTFSHSIEQCKLNHGIETAQLIIHSALEQHGCMDYSASTKNGLFAYAIQSRQQQRSDELHVF